jgi:hypothetical protein
MSNNPYEVSPVIGATAAVAIGAAYVIYKSSNRQNHHVSPQPVKKLKGSVLVNVNDIKCSDERKRDLTRFYKSESIYLRTRGGELEVFRIKNMPSDSDLNPDVVVRELVKLMPSGTDIDGLVYSLSTSIGMDVLIKIGVTPPMVSQPICVVHVATGEVEMLGFIGKDLKGERPDCKYTDWLIRMKLEGNASNRVEYEVRHGSGCDRTTDFI